MKPCGHVAKGLSWGGRAALSVLLCLGSSGSAMARAQQRVGPDEGDVVLDRVVAVVNNRAILASDLDDEIELSVIDPAAGGAQKASPAQVLDELISRALIVQQMRQEQGRTATPEPAEVEARIAEIRKDLPACARANCATDEGWSDFLAAHRLTRTRVERYVRNRMEVLRFIELRFRQGIRVSEQETQDYYRNTLLPQYAAGAKVPTLAEVAPRIEEILLQKQVNALFDEWLKNLRSQGDIEVLDPALELPDESQGAEKADE